MGHQFLEQVQAGLHHSEKCSDATRKGRPECQVPVTPGTPTRRACTLPGCSAACRRQQLLLCWASPVQGGRRVPWVDSGARTLQPWCPAPAAQRAAPPQSAPRPGPPAGAPAAGPPRTTQAAQVWRPPHRAAAGVRPPAPWRPQSGLHGVATTRPVRSVSEVRRAAQCDVGDAWRAGSSSAQAPQQGRVRAEIIFSSGALMSFSVKSTALMAAARKTRRPPTNVLSGPSSFEEFCHAGADNLRCIPPRCTRMVG